MTSNQKQQQDWWSKAARRAWWAALPLEQKAAYVELKMQQKAAQRGAVAPVTETVAEALARATNARLDRELRERLEREP